MLRSWDLLSVSEVTVCIHFLGLSCSAVSCRTYGKHSPPVKQSTGHGGGGSEAQSTRRVYGVLRHVLANGSASFQSHPNHANTFRPNPADRAIPHTKDLRAETGSFGAFKPNTFTCARFFLISRARERVWKGMCQLRLLAFAGMIGREGSSRRHHSDQEMGDPSVLERRLLGAAA